MSPFRILFLTTLVSGLAGAISETCKGSEDHACAASGMPGVDADEVSLLQTHLSIKDRDQDEEEEEEQDQDKDSAPITQFPVKTRPSIGLCVVGLARTFTETHVYEGYESSLMSLLRKDNEVFNFFVLGAGYDDINPRSAYNPKVPLKDQKNGFKSDHKSVQSVVDKFSPAMAVIVPEDELFELNGRCKVPSNWASGSDSDRLQAWYHQWTKVKTCYILMQEYEEKSHRRFDFMMRIRPDLLFLQDVPPNFFQSHAIVVPEGMVVPGPDLVGPGINDHMATCPRVLCASYFLTVDTYNNCTGEWESYLGYSVGDDDDGNSLLANRLHSHHVHVQEVFIAYTIERGCDSGGPECFRLPERWQEHCESKSVCDTMAESSEEGPQAAM